MKYNSLFIRYYDLIIVNLYYKFLLFLYLYIKVPIFII